MVAEPQGLTLDAASGQRRCWWCGQDPLYVAYHDNEWGEGFRAAFADFEIEKVARFTPKRLERLVLDSKIVRHRGKIESTINNARQAIKLIEQEGSLAAFLWRFEPGQPHRLASQADIESQSSTSQAMSKELKRRGWTFVGPTTCYAFMQAMGMINDHLLDCSQWPIVDRARQDFTRPIK